MNLSKKLCFACILCFCYISFVYGYDWHDVVINETMWMGTSRSGFDEFIELRSNIATDIHFDIDPLELYFEDSLLFTVNSGTLQAFGYFVISRNDTNRSQQLYPPNFITSSLVLPNSRSCYNIYIGSEHLDAADDCIGDNASGRYIPGWRWVSMERNNPPGDGTIADNWHVSCLKTGLKAGAPERATPGFANYKNIPPTLPDSVTIVNSYCGDDSAIVAIAHGANDRDNLPLPLLVYFDWYCNDTLRYIGKDSIGPDYSSELPESRTEPGQTWTCRVMLYDDADSVGHVYCRDTVKIHWEKTDITINEVMWMGSSNSIRGEWIELKNRSGKEIDFAQTPFSLYSMNSSGYSYKFLDLDAGTFSPDSFILITRYGDISCNIDVPIDYHITSMVLSDLNLQVSLFEHIETIPQIIDIAGDGDSPIGGYRSTLDSAWYSMSRNSDPGDGTLAENWHIPTVSIGWRPRPNERGTPRSENLTGNNPPVLSEYYPMFTPEQGNRDSAFTFSVVYSDLDNEPAYFVQLLADMNHDGEFRSRSAEWFDMHIADTTDTDFTDGVVYEIELDSIPPQEDMIFKFRASDSLTNTTLGIPAYIGPDIDFTLGVNVSSTVWNIDTIYDEDYVLSPVFEIENSGDIQSDYGFELILADSIPYTGEDAFSSGGLTWADSPMNVGNNVYCISGFFTRPGDIVYETDFNTIIYDDVIIPTRKFCDEHVFTSYGDPHGYDVAPQEMLDMYLLFTAPRFTLGEHKFDRHTIVVALWVKADLP